MSPVIDRINPNGREFQASLVAAIRELADVADGPDAPPSMRDKAGRMRNLADQIASLPSDTDQHIAALQISSRHQGLPSGSFEAKGTVGRILVTAGTKPFKVEDVMAELSRAALEDALQFVIAEQQERSRLREEEITAQAQRVADERIARADERANRATAAAANADERAAELERELRYFKNLKPGPADKAKDRRLVEPGIYVKPSGKYEAQWTEDGRVRFKTLGNDLEEARAFRAEKAGSQPTPETEPTPEAEAEPVPAQRSGTLSAI